MFTCNNYRTLNRIERYLLFLITSYTIYYARVILCTLAVSVREELMYITGIKHSLLIFAMCSSMISGCSVLNTTAPNQTQHEHVAVQNNPIISIDPGYQAGSYSVATYENKTQTTDSKSTDNDDDFDPRIYLTDAAILAENAHDFRSAAVHWYQAYTYDPSDHMIAFRLARALRYEKRLVRAEQVLVDALTLWEDDPLLTLEHAKVMLYDNRIQESLRVLYRLEHRFPEDPAILIAIGSALDFDEQHEEAREYYEAALTHGGPSAILMNNYALSYAMSGDLAKAEELLKKAIISQGDTTASTINLAFILSIRGKTDYAERILQDIMPQEHIKGAIAEYRSMAPNTRNIWEQMINN